jgi:oligopeptide/dipeptide ABC transporter ATP-binding protein
MHPALSDLITRPVLSAREVSLSYAVGRGGWFRKARRFLAVEGVTLHLHRGETLGIVGESGCGKSSLARLLVGLTEPDAGRLDLDGRPMPAANSDEWRALRTRMQMVFQNAGGALDPRLTVRAQVREPLMIHRLPDPEARTAEVLGLVRLGEHLWDRYPGELSGGQLQRVVIARALAPRPDLMVLDEPVSALDVSIQAQIVNLLTGLQRDLELTYVFVSHDLGVVRHVADRVAVMYLGRVVELAPKAALFTTPRHPYTQALLAAIPVPDPTRRRPRTALRGDPPSPHNPPPGCRFHPRCPLAIDRCRTEPPTLRALGPTDVACHRAGEAAVTPGWAQAAPERLGETT